MRSPAGNWIVPDWPAPAGVHALFTTREGGVSEGAFASLNLGLHVGDDVHAVRENRRRLVASVPGEPVWLDQVHGAAVASLDAPDLSSSAAAPEVATTLAPIADAAVSAARNRPCAVLVADCLPVLFCDAAGEHVGVAHAGWRGLAAGVLEKTVAALSVPPVELIAWLGPAIGPDAFEVGEEVFAAFVRQSPQAAGAFRPIAHKPGKYLADIYALARRRLQACGVGSIHGGGLCTVADATRFFSYRRDGRTGRMAAVIWRV